VLAADIDVSRTVDLAHAAARDKRFDLVGVGEELPHAQNGRRRARCALG